MGKDRAASYVSGMFDEWKRAWQQAVDNFERELKASEDDAIPAGTRSGAMRRDLAQARAALNRLDADLEQARKDQVAEEEAEATAIRRAEMADRINDTDTARIAREFAGRHTYRAGILRRKVEVLADELGMRREELAAMEQQAAEELARIEQAQQVDADFRQLDRERREKDAEARLEELKRRMQ